MKKEYMKVWVICFWQFIEKNQKILIQFCFINGEVDNVIELLYSVIYEVIKKWKIFCSDGFVRKMVYLKIKDVSKKWLMLI